MSYNQLDVRVVGLFSTLRVPLSNEAGFGVQQNTATEQTLLYASLDLVTECSDERLGRHTKVCS